MTVSKLATGTVWSPNCSSRNGQRICKFTPHYMAGNLTAQKCGEVFLPKSRKASSNYGISSDGTIFCYVDEETRAWTSSSESNDAQAITVEVANISNVTGEITPAAWAALVKLATDICYRYKFRLQWTGNASGSLTAHYLFSATACPGPYIKSRLNDLAKEVNANLDAGRVSFCGSVPTRSTYTDTSVAGGSGDIMPVFIDSATAYAVAVNSKVIFDRDETYPFVVSVDQNTSKVDHDKLRKLDVVGEFIDAGQLFSGPGKRKDRFEQPRFDEQVAQADDSKMPYGLYATTYARSVQEAQAELDELQILVKRHPPKLGFWLKLALEAPKAKYAKDDDKSNPEEIKRSKADPIRKRNDEIIKLYEDNLVEWGFKDQIGFYCSKEQLDSITWHDHMESWYWWMVRHVDDVSNFSTDVPTPKYFAYDDTDDKLLAPDFESAKNVSLSGGGVGAASSAAVEKAVQWMVDKANTGKVTYSQGTRNLKNPDGWSFDCSSFVITGFYVGGIDVNAGYTGNMRAGFTAAGFTWIPGSSFEASQLQRGDILLNESLHTQVYIGNGEDVNCGSTPARVMKHSVNYGGKGWHGVLRYTGKAA